MRGAVTTRLAGGFVYDSPSGTFRRADLLVRDERIVGLEDPQAEPGAIDVEGLYFLPGLIDCHVHLGMRAEDADPAAVAARPDTDIARDMAAAAERTLRGGVTTVRDLGGWNHLEMALRDQIARGERSGPRLLLAGRLLLMPTGAADYYPGMYEIASGQRADEKAVSEQLALSADRSKMMASV